MERKERRNVHFKRKRAAKHNFKSNETIGELQPLRRWDLQPASYANRETWAWKFNEEEFSVRGIFSLLKFNENLLHTL